MAFAQKRLNLFIRGGPDASATTTLHMGPSGSETKTAPLTMAGQPGQTIPLSISTDGLPSSGTQPLFVNGGYGVGGGGADWQGYASLTTVGTSGINHVENTSLYINSTDTNRSDIAGTLYVSASPQPSSSGVVSLCVAAGDFNVAPLYVRSNPTSIDNTTLKIKTDFDTNVTTSLYIANTVEDNNVTTVIDGKGEPSVVMNLTMKASDVSSINLYTKGFLE